MIPSCVYFSKMKDPISQQKALCTLQSCIAEIRTGMVTNKLHLNDNKTELLATCTPWLRAGVTVRNLTVSSSQIAASSAARNLGVTMNQQLNTNTYVQRICQTAMSHLRNIADIRQCLSHDVTEKLSNAFVTSRLDYSNGLLFSMSAASLRKLQHVQNTAARISTGSRKYDHITPVIHQLHWLPVEYRVQYKILLVTYKALQGQAPSFIKDLLQFQTTGRTLRSSTQDDLYVPRSTLKTYRDRAFSVAV